MLELIISIVALTFSIFAAIAISYTAIISRRTFLAKIIFWVKETYSKDKILEGIHLMQEWRDTFGEKWIKEFIKRRKNRGESLAQDLDRARRNFSHYCHTIAALHRLGIVDDDFIRDEIWKSTRDFLFDYIEPMEKALPYYEDATKTFDLFREIFDRDC